METLKSLEPTPSLFKTAKVTFESIWKQRRDQSKAKVPPAKKEEQAIGKQIHALLDKIVNATTQSVVTAYETRIAKLERERLILAEQRQKLDKPAYSFPQMFELAMTFLANPYKLWRNGNLALKRTVLKLAFSDQIRFDRKTGLRTPDFALPFKALPGFQRES